jgi:hypothetical protein
MSPGNGAPKARNMKARGKREAKRARRLWLNTTKHDQGLKGRNRCDRITPLRGWSLVDSFTRGDAFRFASRLPLAFIFRGFGARTY